jgi:deoxyribodipyrimidine photo-lyase
LIDAGMNELVATGYCSNRVRQNMVSVLAKDMHLDWRIGAEWFQFCLQDHCVAANWGNWQYFAGVGGDPKNRHCRTVSQAMRYDPTGSYVQKWLPHLRELLEKWQTQSQEKNKRLLVSSEICLRPWDFCDTWKSTLVVDPIAQYTWQDKQRLEEGEALVLLPAPVYSSEDIPSVA